MISLRPGAVVPQAPGRSGGSSRERASRSGSRNVPDSRSVPESNRGLPGSSRGVHKSGEVKESQPSVRAPRTQKDVDEQMKQQRSRNRRESAERSKVELRKKGEELQARRDTPTGGGAMGGAMHAQLQALVRR